MGGLTDLSGAVMMEIDAGAEGLGMGEMGKMDLTFAVAFKAPSDLKVEWKGAPEGTEKEGEGGGMGARMMKGMAEGMNLAVTRILRSTIEGFVPAGDSEFDADVKVENGVTTLVITTFTKGVETSREELTLDGNGIPAVMVSTPKNPPAAPAGGGRRGMGAGPADGKSTVKFTYAKEGDLFRLEKMTLDSPRGPMEAKLEYADAGKFKVVRSWELTPAGGPMKFAFRFSEMTVNGKVVELPGAAKTSTAPTAPATPEAPKEPKKQE